VGRLKPVGVSLDVTGAVCRRCVSAHQKHWGLQGIDLLYPDEWQGGAGPSGPHLLDGVCQPGAIT